MTKISVIIPAFNEARRIEETINLTDRFLKSSTLDYEIIVCDDGSTDETPRKLNELVSRIPRLTVIKNQHLGKAQAVRRAVALAQGSYVLMIDADGAVEISQSKKLLRVLESQSADLAIGSREGKEAQRISEPYYRHWLGRVFNTVVKLTTGLKFEDTQCGFKLFKTAVIKDLAQKSKIMNKESKNLKGPLVTAFDVEILVLAQKLGYKIVEVPIIWRHVPTRNVNPLRDSWRMLWDVWAARRS